MKYVSGRVKELKVGLSSYSESKTTLITVGNVNVSGSVTATSFIGDGSALTNVTIPGISTTGTTEFTNLDLSGNLKVAGVSTFVGAMTVGNGSGVIEDSAGQLKIKAGTFYVRDNLDSKDIILGTGTGGVSLYNQGNKKLETQIYGVEITGTLDTDQLNVSGISTFNGQIVGAATSNIIPFLYSNYSLFPSATTYHGAVAHAHNTGKLYYAHGGNWIELVSQETTGTVGTGTERYNIGPVDLTTLDVSGISTFAGNINANGNIVGDSSTNISGINSVTATSFFGDGSGLENTGATLSAASGSQRLVLTSLTSGTMTSAATDADLSFNATSNLLSAGNLLVSGISTLAGNINANGITYLNGHVFLGNDSSDQINVTGRFISGLVPFGNGQYDLGTTGKYWRNLFLTGNAGIGSLTVSGISTFGGNATFTKQLNVGSTVKLGPAGVVTATTFKGDVDAVNIDVDGRADIDDLIVTGVSTFASTIESNAVNVAGGLVANSAKISDLTNGRVVFAGASGELEDSSNLTFDGTTLNGTFSGDGTALAVSIPGISTGGTSEFSNLNLSGIVTAAGAVFGTAKVSDLTDNRVVVAGTGGELEDSTNLTFDGSTLSIIGDATFTGNVTIGGTLTSEDKTNIDSIGIVTARTGVRINSGGLVVTAGVSTFSDAIDANNGANISGGAGLVAATAKVSDLTSGRVVVAGTAGELEDSGSFTFSGGTVTATAFAGDGSALTGITASGLGAIGGLTIKDEGVVVGTAGSVSTIDFRGGLVNVIATAGAAGVATATITSESNPTLAMLSVTGVSTFQSAVGISSDLTLSSTDTGSSAGPILNLYRNSATPADADYLGQIKFQGESDTGVQRNYAKITGKILDASNTSEDGIIEFAHIKAGSQTITARFRSDSLQLLNSTNFSVDGTSEFTGDITSNGHIDLPDEKNINFGADGDLAIGHTSFNSFLHNKTNSLYIGSSDHVYIRTKNTGGGSGPLGGESAIDCKQNAEVALYYNNSKKFETTTTGITVTGAAQATDFNSTSDIRLKTNIQAIEDPLAKVVQIEGVSFNWKEDNRPALGVIADQVEKIIPELVHGDNPKTVNYNGLIGLLIEAVKEQQVQITELKSKLDSLS